MEPEPTPPSEPLPDPSAPPAPPVFPAGPGPLVPPVATVAAKVACVRCGRENFLSHGRCLFCQARLPGAPPVPRVVQHSVIPQEVHRGVSILFWTFGLMLLSNVVLAWYLRGPENPGVTKAMAFDAAMAFTIVEVVDVILVLIAWAFCRKEIGLPVGIGARPRLGWALGLPLLAVLLVINVGYHWLLLSLSGAKPEADQLMASGYYQWWFLALVCVQPAIMEELFFRRLTFDFFCNATSPGTAAVASAMMFAAAHTGGLISLPYLALFGFCLARLRWFTGSLVLPISLHLLHNLLITLHEMAPS